MDAHRQSPFASGALRLTLVSAALLVVAACRQGQETTPAPGMTEIDWARAALERNPKIEVVATDTQAGVFTVREKSTGEVHAVKLSELAAAPISQLNAPAAAPPAASPTEPATATAPSSPAIAQQPDAGDATATASAPADASNYTIERSGGQVRVSGPGVSIVSSGSAENSRGAPGKRTVDPIICEGRQMVHLDNRNIYVDGDAITARGGCELHITNSHIVASGTGLVVRGATAHVSNSTIEGAAAAYDADGSAKLYLSGSTINGMPRRHAYAQVQDLGGNQFRQSQ